MQEQKHNAMIGRAQGCLLGQLAGDALGSLVEFRSPAEIRAMYPDGVRKLSKGGTWNTIAGQPTDDSEMALLLARMLLRRGAYNQAAAQLEYIYWLHSDPFDCGATIAAGLNGKPNTASQANGALMRVSPLGIFGARFAPEQLCEWAQQDAAITHPHPVCLQINALYTLAIAYAIKNGPTATALYDFILQWAHTLDVEKELLVTMKLAATERPKDYVLQQGWVLIAFQNTLWQLLHAQSLEEAIVDTVMQGGDTDTNAAICGALLGAVCGRDAIPDQWSDTLLQCRPAFGKPGVIHPRPELFWPVDCLDLARGLVTGSQE